MIEKLLSVSAKSDGFVFEILANGEILSTFYGTRDRLSKAVLHGILDAITLKILTEVFMGQGTWRIRKEYQSVAPDGLCIPPDLIMSKWKMIFLAVFSPKKYALSLMRN